MFQFLEKKKLRSYDMFIFKTVRGLHCELKCMWIVNVYKTKLRADYWYFSSTITAVTNLSKPTSIAFYCLNKSYQNIKNAVIVLILLINFIYLSYGIKRYICFPWVNCYIWRWPFTKLAWALTLSIWLIDWLIW